MGYQEPKHIKVYNKDNEAISTDKPFPVSDIDGAHRGSANSIFGDKIVGTRIPSIAAQFQYGLRSDDATVDIVGSGVTSFSNAMLFLNTGTDSDGHIGIQGTDYLRYIPGHEAYTFFTVVFTESVADSSQRVGLFDYDSGNGNGFFVGYEGTQFGVTRRRAGVDSFTAVDVTKVYPDGVPDFDPTKGNIYKISYGYLGFATIHFEIMAPHGNFVILAIIDYPNTSTETHIANTNIPLRAEATNLGNTSDIEIGIGSVTAGIVDGGGADPMARWFSQRSPETSVTSGITQIVAFRNKSTFFGITNKITSQLIRISGSTEGTKPVAFFMQKNPTETLAGIWNDINADSVIEYSSDAIFNPATGSELLDFDLSKNDGMFERVDEENIKLRPNEVAVLFVETTGASDVRFSIRYKDLF